MVRNRIYMKVFNFLLIMLYICEYSKIYISFQITKI